MSSEWRYDDRKNAARWPGIRRGGGLDRFRIFFFLVSPSLKGTLFNLFHRLFICLYSEPFTRWACPIRLNNLSGPGPCTRQKNKIKIEQMGQRPVCSTGNWNLGPSNQIVLVTPQKLENPATFFSTNFGALTRYYE